MFRNLRDSPKTVKNLDSLAPHRVRTFYIFILWLVFCNFWANEGSAREREIPLTSEMLC